MIQTVIGLEKRKLIGCMIPSTGNLVLNVSIYLGVNFKFYFLGIVAYYVVYYRTGEAGTGTGSARSVPPDLRMDRTYNIVTIADFECSEKLYQHCSRYICPTQEIELLFTFIIIIW